MLTEELQELLMRLISFQTTADRPDQLADCLYFIHKYFREQTPELHLAEYRMEGKPSLVASTVPGRDFAVLLATHIDVVPAPPDLFIPRVNQGRLYGRGANDMKFAAALFMVLLKKLAAENCPLPVGAIFTSDEEIGGERGTRYLLDKEGYRCKVCILPDSGDNWQIEIAAKGMVHLRLIAQGKSAHGSRPWLGENALDRLIEVYQRLRALYPEVSEQDPWHTTLNLGRIQGGEATNQVPNYGEMYLDIRFTEETTQQEIITQVRAACGEKVTCQVISAGAVFFVEQEDPYFQRFKKIAEKVLQQPVSLIKSFGASDARFFTPYQTPVLLMKPPCAGLHSNEEWIELEGFFTYYKILEQFITSLVEDPPLSAGSVDTLV